MNITNDYIEYMKKESKANQNTINRNINYLNNLSADLFYEGVIDYHLFGFPTYGSFCKAIANVLATEQVISVINRRKTGSATKGGTTEGHAVSSLIKFYKKYFVQYDDAGDAIVEGYDKEDSIIINVNTEFLDGSRWKLAGKKKTETKESQNQRVYIPSSYLPFFVSRADLKLETEKEKIIEFLADTYELYDSELYPHLTIDNWTDALIQVCQADDNWLKSDASIKEKSGARYYMSFSNEESFFYYKKMIFFDQITSMKFIRYKKQDDGSYLYRMVPIIAKIDDKYYYNLIKGKKVEKYVVSEIDFSSHEDFFENLSFGESEERIALEVEMALKNGKNIILIGPPGSGKTELAKQIAASYNAEYRFHTAHSQWSTYETMGGYRQNAEGLLELSEGIILKCFRDRYGHPDNKWLIIDEINRSDINKAFGALFSILAGDSVDDIGLKRNDGTDIQVICEKDFLSSKLVEGYVSSNQYIVPNSWRLVATMNTFDKNSLSEMSYAFMRRFALIYVGIEKYDEDVLKKYASKWNIPSIKTFCNKKENRKPLLEILNAVNSVKEVISPAILKDILLGISMMSIKDVPWTSILTMYILPQLDGAGGKTVNLVYKNLVKTKLVKDEGIRKYIEDFLGYPIIIQEQEDDE